MSIMKITKEETITRLTVEYDNSTKDGIIEVMDYLENRFGKYFYKITKTGPKITGGRTDINAGELVAESYT